MLEPRSFRDPRVGDLVRVPSEVLHWRPTKCTEGIVLEITKDAFPYSVYIGGDIMSFTRGELIVLSRKKEPEYPGDGTWV